MAKKKRPSSRGKGSAKRGKASSKGVKRSYKPKKGGSVKKKGDVRSSVRGKGSRLRKKVGRGIPVALARYNSIRSTVSAFNRQSGRVYNGVELNALVGQIYAESRHVGSPAEVHRFVIDWLRTELDGKLKLGNALDISGEFLDVQWFELHEVLEDRTAIPANLDIVVKAWETTLEFNSSDFEMGDPSDAFNGSGLAGIYNEIKERIGNSSHDATFVGFVKLYAGKKDNGKRENYYLEYVLFDDAGEATASHGEFREPKMPAGTRFPLTDYQKKKQAEAKKKGRKRKRKEAIEKATTKKKEAKKPRPADDDLDRKEREIALKERESKVTLDQIEKLTELIEKSKSPAVRASLQKKLDELLSKL